VQAALRHEVMGGVKKGSVQDTMIFLLTWRV